MEPPLAVVALPIAALLAAAMAVVLVRYPPSTAILLAGTVGLMGALALALLRYELAVTLSFLLMGIVFVEPAPVDGLLAIVMAVAVVTGRFNVMRVPLTITVLLGVFLTLNFLSAIEAIDPGVAGRFMLITVFLAAFALWFTGYVDSRRRARNVIRAYVTGAVVMAGLTTVALFVPFPGSDSLLAYEGTRGKGLLEDPNVYGPFLIPAALILVEELLNPRLLRAGAGLKVTMFVLLVVGVLFSYSRAAWVSLLAALLVLLVVLSLRRGGGKRAAVVLGVLITAGVVAGGILAVTDSLGFLEQRAATQSYDVQRFGAQQRGIELAEQFPFGVGPGQFELLATISAHSTYVRAVAEQGVLGFFTILALFLATLVFAGRNAVLGRDTYGIGSAALLAAWVGLMINSFVVDTLHWRHLWFIAALIWAGTRRSAAPSRNDPLA